jgi:hypothetical protein
MPAVKTLSLRSPGVLFVPITTRFSGTSIVYETRKPV